MKFAIAMSAGLALGLVGMTLPANAGCTMSGNKMICNNAPTVATSSMIKGGAMKPTPQVIQSNNRGLVAAGGGNLVAAGGGNFRR